MTESGRVTIDPALDDLVAKFLARTLPKAQWTHLAHLRVGAWHVDRFGTYEAIERLRRGIRALNDVHGTRNDDRSGYHETITIAYVRLLAVFLAASRASTFEERTRELLTGPLADKDFLLRFWSRDVLFSASARAAWVAPDRPAAGCATTAQDEDGSADEALVAALQG